MTQTSLIQSLRTLMRLLFISNDENAVRNSRGIYILLRCLIYYIDKEGYGAICVQDIKIQEIIGRIESETIQLNRIREEALFIITCNTRWFCDEFRKNSFFKPIVDEYLIRDGYFEDFFTLLYPEADKWTYYKENHRRFPCDIQQSRFDFLKTAQNFSDAEYIELETHKVPAFSGFSNADIIMNFFFANIKLFSDDAIRKMISIYNSNNQFYWRGIAQEEIPKLIDEVDQREMDIDWSQYGVFAQIIQEYSNVESS